MWNNNADSIRAERWKSPTIVRRAPSGIETLYVEGLTEYLFSSVYRFR